LLVLLFFRNREALLAVFIARLFVDIIDTTMIGVSGALTLQNFLIQLLYLVPMSLIIYYLVKHEYGKSKHEIIDN